MSDTWFVQYWEHAHPEVVHNDAVASYEEAKVLCEKIAGNPAFWDVSIVAPTWKEAVKAQKKTDAERAEMYRRQLGGAEKALRRERQKVRDLEDEVARYRKAAVAAYGAVRLTVERGPLTSDAWVMFEEKMAELGIGGAE